MEPVTHQHKRFENLNYAGKEVKNREFEKCSFKGCDFSESNFTNTRFTDSTFVGCNMGLIKLQRSTLDGVIFQDCKLIGVNFHECADLLFSVQFENCLADYASFANKKMSKTLFRNSSLKGAIFNNTVLNKAIFENTDLQNAVFNRSNLQEADFTTAYNFMIDPELNSMKKARFSVQGLQNLLAKYDLQIL